MISRIPTTYKDEYGSVETEIINDYQTLTVIIEGTKFVSKYFNDFSPVDIENIQPRFRLNDLNELTNCSLLCKIPTTATRQQIDISATLIVEIHLDASKKEYNTYCDFSLVLEDKLIEIGQTKHFETAFKILKDKLPCDTYLKCCYNCLYADYSFFGSAIFGTMFCFKSIKEKYLAIRTKDEYMSIFDLYDRQVHEIYLSESFDLRINGTGYRD
jgi:hypothetical protein